MNKIALLLLPVLLFVNIVIAQNPGSISREKEQLQTDNENPGHRLDRREKFIDDVLWFQKVGDIAHADKLYIYGPPKWKEENPAARGAGNCNSSAPRKVPQARKANQLFNLNYS